MNRPIQFTLSYSGADADFHEIDLYDAAQALIGFQRSLALTTHLIINDQIITQAPALKGAKIYSSPAEEGSWRITAGVIITGVSTAIYQLGTTSKDTPIGHLVRSAYDYVVSESLGFHVDYEKTLGKSYEELKEKKSSLPKIEQYQLDSLIEKCSTAISDMHRPIYKTHTAEGATITANIGGQRVAFRPSLSIETYQYLHEVYTEPTIETITGRISSYNANTFKGRIYNSEEGRPVPFELSQGARSDKSIQLIVASLSENALRNYRSPASSVCFKVLKNKSKSGLLKSYKTLDVISPIAALTRP